MTEATPQMDAFASGLKRVERLAAEAQNGDANEATTRFHLIDPVLRDCLGWNNEQIDCENSLDGLRTDYLVGLPAARIVVEAKRESIAFTLPAGIADREVSLVTLLSDPALKAALEQVLGYCQQRSVPIAIATNGHQYVAFLASRTDAVPPLSGRALVFYSLEDIAQNFRLFWDSFSQAGVAQSTLQRRLGRGAAGTAPPQKLSARSLNYPGFRQRTELETDLKILGQLFLLDITEADGVSDDFLRECYCPSGALSQYALVSKEILRTRYALVDEAISDTQPVQGKKGVNPKLSATVLASSLSRRPILLLGDVGVGKTMFIRHLLRVDATDVLDGAIVLYLDFGVEPTSTANLPDFVADRLIEQLRTDSGVDVMDASFIRAVYNGEINQFRKGVAGELREIDPVGFAEREIKMLEGLLDDRVTHVGRCLNHLDGTSDQKVVIVLDNVDQRPPAFQEEVFLIGTSMASAWPATVFIALRPSTFHESTVRGALSGYHSRAFTVYPARTDQVISRRLTFARRQLEETGRVESFPDGLSLDSQSLLTYLDVLIKAFESDDRLKEFLDNLSGGNVRRALDFLNAFVGSGYVSTERILEVSSKGDGDVYNVPLHEFFRAIAYGDAEQYDPRKSPITNVFDISQDDPREHFLLASLVVFAQSRGDAAGKASFVRLDELIGHGLDCGFTQDQVGAQINRAVAGKLLDLGSDEAAGGTCRVNSAGIYTVTKLASMFTYVDAVIVDTPVVDVQRRAQIVEAWTIQDRIARARLFRAYLDDVWAECADAPFAFDWAVASEALRRSIDDADGRAFRASKARRGSQR